VETGWRNRPEIPETMELSPENELWGEYEQSVDDKGRIVLPQDFRGPLGDEFVITRGPDRAVWILPKPQWDDIYRQIRPGAARTRQAALLQRQHGGRAFVRTDTQFRLTIPKHFRDYAAVDESHKAVLVGIGDRVELWSKDLWDTFNRENFSSTTMYDATETLGTVLPDHEGGSGQ